MPAVARWVPHAEDEGLGAVGGPGGFVGEGGGVPDCFVEDLGKADGVAVLMGGCFVSGGADII